MAVVTSIVDQKKRPNRRSVFLDGKFAFGVNVNVAARFRLREGMSLSPEQVAQIAQGEVRQECLDRAMKLLAGRLHSRSELRRKLLRGEYGQQIVEGVIEDLARLGYLDDERFARTKAMSVVQHKQHGRRRAKVELIKAGIRTEVAERALGEVYDGTDTVALARRVALKNAPRLRKLEPRVARRRLAGMLERRGFDYEDIRAVIDEALGGDPEAR
jgi:regulatory protein